ncbi:hypothetical protein [Spirosoma aerolatum]|uniref:hypothetical protein n=1 Tax=Spirosoma aerolatum TaxID=1211326 RepID=UPI0009AEDD46|nr:hypothetical protein [Spirosoma aerolatum]
MLSPLTVYALDEMGNLTQDERATAYSQALEKRLDNLYNYQDIITLPWYGRIWFFWSFHKLLRDLEEEQKFLTYCRKSINWNRVQEPSLNGLCFKLEGVERKLINALNLSNLLSSHV